MTLTGFLHMMLGASLVVIGMLALALVDRIRASRSADRAREDLYAAELADIRSRRAKARAESKPEPKVEPKVDPEPEVRRKRQPTHPVMPAQDVTMANEVATALMGIGYSKRAATDAVAACAPADRVSIEAWTKAALRSCARAAA